MNTISIVVGKSWPQAAALLAVLLLLMNVSCGHNKQSAQTMPTGTNVSDTTLGVGDVFNVDVFNEKELSGKFRVSAAGTVDYPLVGTIKVSGLTPPEVAELLRKNLAGKYLKEPYVMVFVDNYQSKKISVYGQVSKPGTYPYVDNMSIIEAITTAGGATAIASKNDVTVTRVQDGKINRYNVRVEDIAEGKSPNYQLKPGDIIFIPERVF